MVQYKEVVRQICKVVLEQRFSFAAISNDIGGVHSLNPPPHALATYPTPKLLVSDTCQHLLCCGIDLYTVKKCKRRQISIQSKGFYHHQIHNADQAFPFGILKKKIFKKDINLKIR